MAAKAASSSLIPTEAWNSKRWWEAGRIVDHHVLAALGLGVVPLPLLDTALIIGVQVNMLRRLASLYEIPFSQARSKSAIAVLLEDPVHPVDRALLNTQSLHLHQSEVPPAGLPAARDAWIFRLDPGMSERHWIIVSRSAAKAPYQKLS